MMWFGYIAFVLIPALLVFEVLRCLYLELRRDRIPILLYHRLISRQAVLEGRVPDNEPIYASYDDVFASQSQYLKDAGYTTLNFDDFLAIRAGRMPLPQRSVIITLDDGYESNFLYAYPALKRHGQKATIFVAPEPNEYTLGIVHGIDRFLSPEQMRELDANGVSIESHTLTHCVLSDLSDEKARYELEESRRRLSEILCRPVRHIAIPRAGYSRRIERLVRECGYQTACCNNKGSSTGLSDPWALPRIVIERDMSLADFQRLLRPRAALLLRLVGNFKRIPERLFGPHGADAFRKWLLRSPLGPLLVTRRLKRALAVVALLYLAAGVIFFRFVLT